MRIVVIGTSGCGKSTFARSLAAKLALYTALRQDVRYADSIWTQLETPAEARQFLQAGVMASGQ